MDSQEDRTASLMTPAKLAQVAGAASAPVPPAQFLDRMAADVGHQHVHRLGELRLELESQGQGELEQAEQAEATLQRMRDALPQIDFAPLQQRSWWADVTGKSRATGTAFVASFDTVGRGGQGTGRRGGCIAEAPAAALHGAGPHAGRVQRRVPGARQGHPPGRALAAGHAQPDQGAPVRGRRRPGAASSCARTKPAANCWSTRLKLLRAAATASQQAYQEVLAVAQRRADFAAGHRPRRDRAPAVLALEPLGRWPRRPPAARFPRRCSTTR